jgi:hypothetical protein
LNGVLWDLSLTGHAMPLIEEDGKPTALLMASAILLPRFL